MFLYSTYVPWQSTCSPTMINKKKTKTIQVLKSDLCFLCVPWANLSFDLGEDASFSPAFFPFSPWQVPSSFVPLTSGCFLKFCPMYHMCPLKGVGFPLAGAEVVFETRNMNVALCLFLFSWMGQEDALRGFFQPRELAGPEKCFCESCRKKTTQKQVLFKSIQPLHSLGLPVGFPGRSLQAP